MFGENKILNFLKGQFTIYMKSDDNDDDDNGGHPQVVVDHNDNRTGGGLTQTDSAYASQQSLAKQQQIRTGSFSAEEHQPQQLLPVTYSMKDQLLASELWLHACAGETIL